MKVDRELICFGHFAVAIRLGNAVYHLFGEQEKAGCKINACTFHASLRQVLEKSGVKPQGLASPEEAEKVVGCSMGTLRLNQGADELSGLRSDDTMIP